MLGEKEIQEAERQSLEFIQVVVYDCKSQSESLLPLAVRPAAYEWITRAG